MNFRVRVRVRFWFGVKANPNPTLNRLKLTALVENLSLLPLNITFRDKD